MSNEKTIVEINGVKIEIDLRTARKVEEMQVGSRVKVLVKESYGEGCAVHAGTIVGFDAFPDLPTIQIAYIDRGYAGGLKFISFNASTKLIQIIADDDNASLEIDKGNVLETMDRAIDTKEAEVSQLRRTREFFLARFGAYFGAPVTEAA